MPLVISLLCNCNLTLSILDPPSMGPIPFNQHGGTNDLPVKPTQPQRAASLTRFREKRKERCFDKRICYTQSDGEAKGSDVIAMVAYIAPSAVNGDNSGMTVGRKL
ncbi:hypothetical protein C1H46_008670 [Malus baccata]|uniref:CCT domain-containing protein n=1 Tax=Malus baccata TaxID=106549 RepID=A0A540N419_MALBA|nr:hypothetical protein C1H46_008670 [Malus baccata]